MSRIFLPTTLALAITFGGMSGLAAQDFDPTRGVGNELIQDDPPRDPETTLVVPPQTGLQSDFQDLPPMPPPPGQSIIMRERYAGWNQAHPDLEVPPSDGDLRSHWVLIADSGELQGSVTAAEDIDVRNLPIYLLRHGRPMLSTRTDEQGEFRFSNVSSGTYSLVGFGEQALFAYAFNAIEYKESLDGKMPAEIRVRAVENRSTINLDWIRYFAPKVEYRVYGRFESGEGTEDPARLLGLEGLSLIPPQATPATTIRDHSVALTPDNRLVGRVHQVDSINGRPVDVRNSRAILLENNDVAAATSVNNYGVFQFFDVPPGNYGLVIAGADGFGCVGIHVVEDLFADEHTGPLDVTLVTSETVGWLNNMAHEVAYQRIVRRTQAGNGTCACECEGPCGCGMGGDGDMYQRRNRPFNRVFRFMNDMFDEIFYGESNPYNSQQYRDGRYQPRAF